MTVTVTVTTGAGRKDFELADVAVIVLELALNKEVERPETAKREIDTLNSR